MKYRNNVYVLAASVLAVLAACGSSSTEELTKVTDYPLLEGMEHLNTAQEFVSESSDLTQEEKTFALTSLDALGVPVAGDGIQRSAINTAIIDPDFIIDDTEKFFTLDTVRRITVTRNDINEIYAGLTESNGAPTYRNARVTATMMSTTNERSFPILTDGRGSHAAFAGRFYSGRTAFFSKDDWIKDMAEKTAMPSGEKLFYSNLLSWLTAENPNGYRNKVASNSSMNVLAMPGTISRSIATPNLNITVGNIPANENAGTINPNIYPLVVISETMTDDQINVLKDYLGNGGAILASRNLWNLLPGDINKSLYGNDIMKYPYVRFMKEAGGAPIKDALLRQGLYNGYPLLAKLDTAHITTAYPPEAAEYLVKVFSGEITISTVAGVIGNTDTDKFSALSQIAGRLTLTNPQNPAIKSLIENTGVIFAGKLSKERVDCDADVMLCDIQRSLLLNAKIDANTPAHPAASQYPGTSKNPTAAAKTVLVTDKVLGSGYASPSTWVSTDRWANAGQVIKITTPASMDPKLDVIIGAQTDYLEKRNNAIRYLDRLPKISWRIKLQPGLNKFATPAGGNIFLIATEKAAGMSTAVVIEDAITAPHFVLGSSDPTAFMNEVKSSDVPYIEFESNRFKLIIPNASAKAITDPVRLANGWDQQMTWTDELLGHSPATSNDIHQTIAVKHVIVLDKQISAGWMHAGYPIMYPDVASIRSGMVNSNNPNGIGTGWGDPHEYGHNFQTAQPTNDRSLISLPPLYPYNFAPLNDITNNILSLHHQFKRRQVDRLTTDDEFKTAWAYLNKPARNFSQVGFWDGLTFFAQYHIRYGWDFHAKFLRKYREHAYGINRDPEISKFNLKLLHTNNPTTQDQYDAFALFSTRVTGFDQTANLTKWGIPVSASVSQAIASWRYPSDEDITKLRNDCTAAKTKDPGLICIQPSASTVLQMVTDRPIAAN